MQNKSLRFAIQQIQTDNLNFLPKNSLQWLLAVRTVLIVAALFGSLLF